MTKTELQDALMDCIGDFMKANNLDALEAAFRGRITIEGGQRTLSFDQTIHSWSERLHLVRQPL